MRKFLFLCTPVVAAALVMSGMTSASATGQQPRMDAVTVTNITPTTADASWTKPVGATSFVISYGPKYSGWAFETYSADVQFPVKLTGLVPGQLHEIKIRAFYGNQSTPWSPLTQWVTPAQ